MPLPGFLQSLFGRKPKPDAPLLPADVPKLNAGVIERSNDPEPEEQRAPLAPYPSIDRYPVILGSSVSLAYISSVLRLCLTGYRREFCDLLDELLERDPHMYAVVAQRVHAVAGGRIQVIAAETDGTDGGEQSTEAKRAEEIRAYVEKCFERIPDLQQSLSKLQWGGLFYGVGAAEISWRQDESGWYPARLHWIHSRRLNYPDPNSWAVRVWDQGAVSSYDILDDPTARLFGVSCQEFPGKFIVHTPSVRGNYPTRDGLGRELVYWSALKLMGARGAAQYMERFGKPWVVTYYATGEKQSEHRAADDEDVKAAEAAAKALGIGSLTNATLPDSTNVQMYGPAVQAGGKGQLFHGAFIALCNGEMSKGVLGQTDTTEAGPNGSRSATETRKEGTKELYRYDAAALGDTIDRQLVRWIVRLNFPNEERIAPRILVHAAETPDLDAMLKRAIMAANSGAVVDADKVCEETGVPTLPRPKPGDKMTARRLYPVAALKPYELQSLERLDAGIPLEAPPKVTRPSAEMPADGTAEFGGEDADAAAEGGNAEPSAQPNDVGKEAD